MGELILTAGWQVAWLKNASQSVRSAVKPEHVLIHWFDKWEEVASEPTRSDSSLVLTIRALEEWREMLVCEHFLV